MPIHVHLGFDTPDHRDLVVERLRELGPLPDGGVVDDEDGVRLEIEARDPRAAVARAQVLLQGALHGSGVDPSRVALSVAGGW